MDVHTRGGSFGAGGYGGGIFDGSEMGFGGLGAAPRFEQAAAGVQGLGAFTWCSKAQPCSSADPNVIQLQKDLNVALRAHGFKLLTVDGKLGAGTCGAISWTGTLSQDDPFFSSPGAAVMTSQGLVDSSGAPVCKSFTYPTPVGSTKPFVPPSTFRQGLPWMEVTDQTGKVQGDINNDLTQHGYDPVQVTGMLDAPTCGAMQTAKNEWGMDYLTAYGANCQKFTPPHRHVTPGPVAPPPHADVTTPTPVTTRKSGVSTAWVVGGLAVAAGVAGLFAVSKKKRF